jgi:acetyltransferase
MRVPRDSVREVFYPKSIAVVGASKDPTKRGFRSIQKLIEDGYPGAIYPINPKEAEILGLKCYPDIVDVPGIIDLAIVCTPAKTLPDLMCKFSEKRVKGAVVLAGGFAEAGIEGATLQADMVNNARRGGVRIIGPNTSGIFNTHQSCNIVGFSNLQKGPIGLLSQSGNMALSLVTEAQGNGETGLSTYVGIGNESDIRFDEYLEYFEQDENTKVVIAYVEGVKDGRKFLDALRRMTKTKPVVVYKSGRTAAGITSAKSHTGALAGNYSVNRCVLKQAGAILIERTDEIFPVAECLSLLPPLRSRNVAVLSDGGGHATIAADLLTESHLALADISEETRQNLRNILPAAAAVNNPIDVAGGTDANPTIFSACAEILLADPSVDALLITGLFGGYAVRFSESLAESEIITSDAIASLSKATGKPVLVHSLYVALEGVDRPAPLSRLRTAGIPIYSSLEHAVRSLSALASHGETSRRTESRLSPHKQRLPAIDEIIKRSIMQNRGIVLEPDGREILELLGVPMSPSRLVESEDAAAETFHDYGSRPSALKIVSRDIVHKTEAGGVALNITSEEAARKAFADIMRKGRTYSASADISGVIVTPMADRGGVEIIVGVVSDPTYGPVMMFGLGGILVEVIRDVTFRSLPLTADDAKSMISEIKGVELLNGIRGGAPVDRDSLIHLMLRLSDLVMAYPEIAELDLNPVFAYPDKIDVVDVRVLLDTQPKAARR